MVQSYSLGGANVPFREGTLAPPGKYDWTCGFLWLTRVHNPSSKSMVSAVFEQLTAGNPYILQWAPHQNGTFPWGIWTPSNLWFLGPIQAHTQMASWLVQPFYTDDRRVSLYFTMGSPFPSKIAPLHEGSGPHLIHGSLGPPDLNGISTGSAIFAELTTATDRPTDRQTTPLGL